MGMEIFTYFILTCFFLNDKLFFLKLFVYLNSGKDKNPTGSKISSAGKDVVFCKIVLICKNV